MTEDNEGRGTRYKGTKYTEEQKESRILFK
jgi:hypothetical protein